MYLLILFQPIFLILMLGWLFIPVYISAGVSSVILTFRLSFSLASPLPVSLERTIGLPSVCPRVFSPNLDLDPALIQTYDIRGLFFNNCHLPLF